MADVFVVGSINQDFVLSVERRPAPGETVTDARLATHNGGKGANQAAAAALLGASVAFLGRVGDDGFGGPLVRGRSQIRASIRALCRRFPVRPQARPS